MYKQVFKIDFSKHELHEEYLQITGKITLHSHVNTKAEFDAIIFHLP